jgi:hypothetical protein
MPDPAPAAIGKEAERGGAGRPGLEFMRDWAATAHKWSVVTTFPEPVGGAAVLGANDVAAAFHAWPAGAQA